MIVIGGQSIILITLRHVTINDLVEVEELPKPQSQRTRAFSVEQNPDLGRIPE
jgi:hypothetical protein